MSEKMEKIDPSWLVEIAPGYYKVVRPGDAERAAEAKKAQEEYHRALYNHVEMVTTEQLHGPRGFYYEWCALRPDGTLDFGEEEGNYAGGHTLSPLWYPGAHDYCERQTSLDVGNGYWYYAKRKLEVLKRQNNSFYVRIMAMLDKHGVKLPEEVAL